MAACWPSNSLDITRRPAVAGAGKSGGADIPKPASSGGCWRGRIVWLSADHRPPCRRTEADAGGQQWRAWFKKHGAE